MNLYKLHKDPHSLQGFENRQTHVPALLHKSMRDKQLTDHQLKKITKDPTLALEYARMRKHVWAPGEKAIATDPLTAYTYAIGLIGAPWPPGEEAIAKNPRIALAYDVNVLHTAFPLGEKAISKSEESQLIMHGTSKIVFLKENPQ